MKRFLRQSWWSDRGFPIDLHSGRIISIQQLTHILSKERFLTSQTATNKNTGKQGVKIRVNIRGTQSEWFQNPWGRNQSHGFRERRAGCIFIPALAFIYVGSSTFNSSTSKISNELGPIEAGAFCPYPSSGGIQNLYVLPSFIKATPSLKPAIIWSRLKTLETPLS